MIQLKKKKLNFGNQGKNNRYHIVDKEKNSYENA
jgi:ureidoglycolate hydrolase